MVKLSADKKKYTDVALQYGDYCSGYRKCMAIIKNGE